ncbi:MAG: hypothetical protein GXP39_14645 [Chloroflexi bacterium]|nr:hypothetical protein [Chloroflexota bacterium]
MDIALWTYPWDVLDEGIDAALDRIAATGVDGISLAVAYHAARTLSPRGPRRRIRFLEDGVVYFRPEAARYTAAAPLSPQPSQLCQERDPLEAIGEAAQEKGLALHAWTVLTHNSRLGRAHVELTFQNAFGDRYTYALCPAQPAVRAYASALCGDLARRYPLVSLELESVGYMGFGHESHHDKIGVQIDRLHQVCLSLCFCPACRERIAQEGGDPEALAQAVRAELEAYFERDGGIEVETEPEVWARLGEILGEAGRDALFQARQRVILDMLRSIREAVGDSARLSVMAADSPLISGAVVGVPLKEAARWADAILLLDYAAPTERLASDIRRWRETLPGVEIGTGMSMLWPLAREAHALAERAAALASAGAGMLRLYNYGLMSRPRLGWVSEIVQAVRGVDAGRG